MYNHNKAQQSKKRVHISWDILYCKIVLSEKIGILKNLHCIARLTIDDLIVVIKVQYCNPD